MCLLNVPPLTKQVIQYSELIIEYITYSVCICYIFISILSKKQQWRSAVSKWAWGKIIQPVFTTVLFGIIVL